MEGNKIAETSKRLQVILAEIESPFQAAVLADLTALWLAGHLTERKDTTAGLRNQLWEGFQQAVMRLLPGKDELVRANLKNLRNPR